MNILNQKVTIMWYKYKTILLFVIFGKNTSWLARRIFPSCWRGREIYAWLVMKYFPSYDNSGVSCYRISRNTSLWHIVGNMYRINSCLKEMEWFWTNKQIYILKQKVVSVGHKCKIDLSTTCSAEYHDLWQQHWSLVASDPRSILLTLDCYCSNRASHKFDINPQNLVCVQGLPKKIVFKFWNSKKENLIFMFISIVI